MVGDVEADEVLVLVTEVVGVSEVAVEERLVVGDLVGVEVGVPGVVVGDDVALLVGVVITQSAKLPSS